MMRLNDSDAVKFAKELTIVAMEHGMIPACQDSKDTAQSVNDFFITIADFLNSKHD